MDDFANILFYICIFQFKEGKDARKDQQTQLTNGAMPAYLETNMNIPETKVKGKMSSRLAAKLSPKAAVFREQNTSKLKVLLFFCFFINKISEVLCNICAWNVLIVDISK